MAFLQDIALGRYIALDSPIHRLDPRTKLGAVFALTLAAFASPNALALLLLGAFLLVATALARVPSRLLLRQLKTFAWLFLFTFGLHALLTPGRAVLPLPFSDHVLTAEGLHLGAFFTARLAAAIIAATLLTLTTAPTEITSGLERLFNPLRRFGFPADDMALMISIALRFIPVLLDEAERLRKAQLARGADFSGSFLRRIKNLVPLLVPLLVAACGRADRLALAMESRCYASGAERTHYRPLRFGRADGLSALAALGLVALVYFLR